MISIRPVISKSSSAIINSFVTVSSESIIIGILVTLMLRVSLNKFSEFF